MAQKNIRVITFGGGIAFSYKKGVAVIGDMGELFDSLHEVANIAIVKATAFHRTSSSAMLVDDIIFLSQEIKRLIAEEHVDGFVVVQGTDTIEETAFALNTLIDTPIPVVVTGAIRIPDMKGADGPANLLASIRVAASDNCRGLGTVVVFNDMIFPADYVRQIHTYVPNAFDAECGPLGFIAEGIPSLRVRPIIRRIPHIDIKTVAVKLVPIYTVSIGDDGKLLTAVKSLGYKGLVLEALGGGHVPTSLVFILEQLQRSSL